VSLGGHVDASLRDRGCIDTCFALMHRAFGKVRK
jgi:hypothetical protein